MPSVRGKRVLVIGDSLSASTSAPGGVLASAIRRAGAADVRVDARVSRSAVNLWNGSNGEVGATVIAADVAWRPDLVVVALGTNDAATGVGGSAADEAAFRRIVASFPARTSLWSVGPPAFPARPDLDQKTSAVYTTLSRVFGSSRVIDSRPLTLTGGRTADGVHFTAAGGQLVGQRIADRFLQAGAGAGVAVALMVAAVAGYVWLR